jgi:hypothetical protein
VNTKFSTQPVISRPRICGIRHRVSLRHAVFAHVVPRNRRLAASVAALAAGLAAFSGTSAAHAATPAPTPPPSAIGSESPAWIQAAPNYQRTGLVVAVASSTSGCSGPCTHLWVSHDGGGAWRRAAGQGWDGGRVVVAADARGHDVLYAASGSGLLRSDDAGDTWIMVGPNGTPAISPTYATDGGSVATAVAQGGDYVLRGSARASISGSNGSLVDMSFAYTSSFPSGGKYPPLLLTAEDKQQHLPVIQQCAANYACTGAATLSGAVYFSSPVTLLPSSDFANDGAVFAQSGRGIYKSTNGGQAFALIPLGDPSATATATPMLALAPGYREGGPDRTAWAAVFQIFQNKSDPKQSRAGGGIFRTEDGGTTWHALAAPGPFDGGAMSVAAAPDGRMFGGYVGGTTGHSGLLCSTDRGDTWQPSCPPLGSAANDPGPAPGSVQACTTCSHPSAPSAVAQASSGAAQSSPGGINGLSVPGAPGSGGNEAAPSNQRQVASAQSSNSGGRWTLAAAGIAIALAATALGARRRRRRTGIEP